MRTYPFIALFLAAAFFAACGRSEKTNGRTGPPSMVYRKSMRLSTSDLGRLERTQDSGHFLVSSNSLVFSGQGPHIVVSAGPKGDMYAFRIQSHRNPTLVFSEGAFVTMTVANVDPDMQHSLFTGIVKMPFAVVPDTVGMIGTAMLAPDADGSISANEIAFHVGSPGIYTYFCSFPAHARAGMWGTMIVANSETMESVLQRNKLSSVPTPSASTPSWPRERKSKSIELD